MSAVVGFGKVTCACGYCSLDVVRETRVYVSGTFQVERCGGADNLI